MMLHRAFGHAEALLERLRTVPGVLRAEVAGSLRRRKETVGDIDLLVAANDAEPVVRAFTQLSGVSSVLAEGPTKASVRLRAGEDAGGVMDHTPVSAVMTSDVFAVRADVSLEALTDVLLQRGIGGAPVVDEEGRPVGVVSKTDLLDQRFVTGDTGEAMARGRQVSRGHYRVQLGPGVHAEALPYDSVADAMTRAAITLTENDPVARAAAIMVTQGIHRVLVVSDDGKLSGIVTGSDIMRWVAQRARHLPSEA